MRRAWGVLFVTAAGLAATPALAGSCQVGRIAELPVTMQGLRPIVAADINGHSAPFILDSGAFFSTISPGVAKALDLKQDTIPGFYLRGIGGASDAGVTRVAKFTLAGIVIPNVQFVVGGSDIGQTGLLGQNVLGLADVEYDLPGGAVRLFRPKGCEHFGMAYWTGGKPSFTVDVQPLDTAQRHTVAQVELDGAKLQATFDTGAPTTVVSLRAAARAGVKPGDPGVERAGWTSGLGSHVTQGWRAHFGLLKIGTEELHNVHLHVADLPPEVDMLIGADYFVSHRIYVSNAQHRLYFTYTGGRLFDTGARIDANAPIAAAGGRGDAEPTDAAGFSARGAMYATQRDLPHALADLSRAVELAPKEAGYAYQRAVIYLQLGRPAPAMADLDTALTLAPDDTRARLLRAQVAMRGDRREAALGDLDQLATALPRSDMERLAVGQLYAAADAFPRAIAQYDLWLDTHPGDSHRAAALNGRCWARTLADQDLAKARADCSAAIKLIPGNPSYRDSRGLAALRMGDLDAALADYDAALAINPRQAWSLYGRAIIERRRGQADGAAKDMAAAAAIDPQLAERAKRYGVE